MNIGFEPIELNKDEQIDELKSLNATLTSEILSQSEEIARLNQRIREIGSELERKQESMEKELAEAREREIDSRPLQQSGWDEFEPFDEKKVDEEKIELLQSRVNELESSLKRERAEKEALESELNISSRRATVASSSGGGWDELEPVLDTTLEPKPRQSVVESVVFELDQEKKDQERKIENLMSELDEVRRERDNLIQRSVESSQMLEAKDNELKRLWETANFEKEEIQTQLKMLQANLETNNHLLHDMEALKEKKHELEDLIADLNAKLESKMKEVNDLNENWKEMESSIKEMMKENEEIRQQLTLQNADLLAECDTLKIEKEGMEQKLRENSAVQGVEVTKADLEAKKAEVNAEIDRITSDIKSMEEKIIENQTIYNQLSENLVAWQNSNTAIEHQIIDLQERNSSLMQQKSALEESQSSGEAADRLKQTTLESQFAERSSQVEQLESEVNSLRTSASQLEAENERLKSRLVELETSLNTLMREKDTLIGEIDRLRFESSDLSKKETTTTQQKASNDGWDSFEPIIDDQTDKDQTIASLESELNDLKRQISEVESIRDENNRLK